MKKDYVITWSTLFLFVCTNRWATYQFSRRFDLIDPLVFAIPQLIRVGLLILLLPINYYIIIQGKNNEPYRLDQSFTGMFRAFIPPYLFLLTANIIGNFIFQVLIIPILSNAELFTFNISTRSIVELVGIIPLEIGFFVLILLYAQVSRTTSPINDFEKTRNPNYIVITIFGILLPWLNFAAFFISYGTNILIQIMLPEINYAPLLIVNLFLPMYYGLIGVVLARFGYSSVINAPQKTGRKFTMSLLILFLSYNILILLDLLLLPFNVSFTTIIFGDNIFIIDLLGVGTMLSFREDRILLDIINRTISSFQIVSMVLLILLIYFSSPTWEESVEANLTYPKSVDTDLE